jgi:hypothetical protein
MKTIYRDFLIRCHVNRGGRYLVPVSCAALTLTPEDPVLDYVAHDLPAMPEPLRAYLLKRGDLVTLKAGDRITRRSHIGKSVRRVSRARRAFVQVRLPYPLPV